MAQTLGEFLSQDIDELIQKQPDLAGIYKSCLIHVVEKQGKYLYEFSSVQCTDEGDCVIRVAYK